MRSLPKLPIRRNAQLVRILHIMRDLNRLGGVDLQELAARYGTTTRTIRRDFAALEEAGLPLEQSPGEQSPTWQLQQGAGLGRLGYLLDTSHFLAQKVVEAQSSVARSVPAVLATLEDLSEKMERALGPKGRQQLREIENCFYQYDKYLYQRAPKDLFWPIVEAIARRRLCEVTYSSPKRSGQATTFDILPLKLFVHQNAPYLMSHILKYNTVGSLNLHRLASLTVLDRQGEVPATFSPELLENAAFGVWVDGPPVTYVLLFDAEIAPYIAERRWHPSQSLERHANGELTLTFTCHSHIEVEAWVASWRQHVRVVAPQGLKKNMNLYGKFLLDAYCEPD
jgi:predicted DNA-binding transcriptional regulator YafY